MIVLSVEAGIIANVNKFIADGNTAALRAGVAFLFLIEVPYGKYLLAFLSLYARADIHRLLPQRHAIHLHQ
jgi:hypothetical protein